LNERKLLGIVIHEKGKDYVADLSPELKEQVKEVVGWDRTLQRMVDDNVILYPEEGRKYIEKNGDPVVYNVLNLSKCVPKIIEISEKHKVYCDITVLNHGVISDGEFGELFLTYGHQHEQRFGEIYSVLAGHGLLLYYAPDTNVTIAVRMKEGDEHYIPPGYIHRFYCSSEGVVLAGVVPHEAGHDYEAVKQKGFPYHSFYNTRTGGYEFVKNPNFHGATLNVVKADGSLGAIEKYFSNPEEVRKMLEKEE